MKLTDSIQRLLRRYESNPAIKGLIQLVPFGLGAAVDAVVTTKVNQIREERSRAFFDELATGNVEITQAHLESEDFLHAYFATVRAALNTRRKEKIRAFARMLKSAATEDSLSGVDEYEEYLAIFDDLSLRELNILIKLEEYEQRYPRKEEENELKRVQHYWDDFAADVEQDFNIAREELEAMLARLTRSGCYEPIVGAYLGYTGGTGKLTPLYYRLKELVDNRFGEHGA